MITRRKFGQAALAIGITLPVTMALSEDPAPAYGRTTGRWEKLNLVVDLPALDGPIVSMVYHQGDVYVACKHGKIYRMTS